MSMYWCNFRWIATQKRLGSGIFICFLVCLSLLFVSTKIAVATTYTVNSDGSGDYTDLQDAIIDSNVVDGDIILVAPGTYTAHTTTQTPSTSTFHIKKSLTIRSTSGANVTTLTIPSTEYKYVVYIYADNVTLSGFTITGGYGGVNVYDFNGGSTLSNVLLKNLIIDCIDEQNQASPGHGINIKNVTDSTVQSCTIQDSYANGIYISGQSEDIQILNCTIKSTTSQHGIAAQQSDNINLQGNTITNSASNGILLDDSQNSMVDSNMIIYAEENGILVYKGSDDCQIIGNTVQETSNQHAIAVQDSLHDLVTGNVVTGSGYHGIILNGTSYSRVHGNYVSGHEYDGITITDSSNGNWMVNNIVISNGQEEGRSDGTGLWVNNESDGNYVFGNHFEGAVENGMAVFSSSNTLIEGNVMTKNGHGGIYVYYDTSRGADEVPTNNVIHRNYSHGNVHNYQIQLRTANDTDIGFNYLYSDSVGNIGGVRLESATNAQIYENTMQDLYYGEYVDADSTGVEVFRNIHLDIEEVIALSPAKVSFDASVTLGGNYWSDHEVTGNPSRNSPYSDIIYDDETRATGVYEDEYPFAKETLGRAYSMCVEEPLKGIKIGSGSIKTIRWISTGSVLVDIYLSSSTAGVGQYIVKNYADVGLYRWEVPSLLAADDYVITIVCKDSNGNTVGVNDTSEAFSIMSDGTNDLLLMSPTRGQLTNAGETLRVSWIESQGSGSEGVSVYLKYDDNAWTLYASGVTQHYVDITLPDVSTNCAAVYISRDTSGVADSTDGYFSIRDDNTYSVTSPASGDKWKIGDRKIIEWISPNTSYLVDIDLYQGQSWYSVATNLPDVGRYTWLVPDLCTNDAKIRISYKDIDGETLGITAINVFDVVYSLATGALVPRYRLFSKITKEHHFTTSENEYNVLGGYGWKQEGCSHQVYNAPYESGGVKTVPLYRLYSTTTLRHLWTTNRQEYLTLRAFSFWRPEGPAGYIFPRDEAQPSGSIALYRLRYQVPVNGGPLHHWTTSKNEYETLSTTYGWIKEKLVGYVVPN